MKEIDQKEGKKKTRRKKEGKNEKQKNIETLSENAKASVKSFFLEKQKRGLRHRFAHKCVTFSKMKKNEFKV